MNSQIDEDFLEFESKVNQVVKILEEMNSVGKTEAESSKGTKKVIENIDEDFIVTVRENRSVINRKSCPNELDNKSNTSHMDKFTFMQQVEQDANERANARHEREKIAQNFRSLGNEAYRKQQYEKAINMYTKAIDHVKDSPILYNNRALAYIKLKNYKRGIIDCDYVLNKLEEKNLRSWLYRAAAYKRLGDDKNFETSIKFAKKNNSKETEYIDNFLEKLRTDQF